MKGVIPLISPATFSQCDARHRKSCKELTRTREALIDHFIFSNSYHTTDECWNRYFLQFAPAANLKRKTGWQRSVAIPRPELILCIFSGYIVRNCSRNIQWF